MIIEICATTINSVINANKAGADRIELCSNYNVGGLTPSIEFIKESLKISLSNPKFSSFPARKLTKIGGEFPSWSNDSEFIYWSIGKSFSTYNLSKADEFDKK